MLVYYFAKDSRHAECSLELLMLRASAKVNSSCDIDGTFLCLHFEISLYRTVLGAVSLLPSRMVEGTLKVVVFC